MDIMVYKVIHLEGKMYIYKILIKNFRNIKDLEWKPDKNLNIIIGPNGCGKSTLATALDYLLNPYLQWYNRTLSEMDYYDRDTSNPILIEVWFKDLNDFIEDDGELLFEHIDENDNISENGQELVLITRLRTEADRKVIHTIYANGQEYPFKQTHKGLIKYKYIEADRDPLKELSFVNNSVLSKIVQNDKLNDLLQGIINDFNNNSCNSLMSDPDFKEVMQNLGTNFANFDLVARDEMAIGIEATELTERKTLQAFSLVCKNKSTTKYIPLKYQSRGIKNLMLLIALQETMGNIGILYLEEPEQNLEPFMQRKIIRKINSSNKGQAFFTTHSIEVAKIYDFNNIFLMKDGKIKSLPQPKEIDSAFEARIEKYAKRELLSGLFSKGVLLVEGDSESSGLPLFSLECDNSLEDSGVEVIKGDGKDNVYKYASFYNKCSVPCISLIDNDFDIDGLLNKFEENNIKCLIINLPKDYETSIISTEIFKAYWKELFEIIFAFNKYKDNYLKPFNSSDSKSAILKQKYEEQQSIRHVKSLEELIGYLSPYEIEEFQREFLHINLAGITQAKYVATYLIDKAKDDENADLNFVPTSFTNMFNLIGVFMDNNYLCEKADKCIIHKVIDTEFNCQNICEKCANIKDGYNNVLQLKGE
jgi:putative ATP-dependent endonuclease of OLD family